MQIAVLKWLNSKPGEGWRSTCDDDAFALGVVLGPPGASEHLHDVQRGQLTPGALLGVVHLGTLDDHSVGRQIHSPGQRSC